MRLTSHLPVCEYSSSYRGVIVTDVLSVGDQADLPCIAIPDALAITLPLASAQLAQQLNRVGLKGVNHLSAELQIALFVASEKLCGTHLAPTAPVVHCLAQLRLVCVYLGLLMPVAAHGILVIRAPVTAQGALPQQAPATGPACGTCVSWQSIAFGSTTLPISHTWYARR
jgi:hypothetical protein